MVDFKWIDELVESVTGHLRQAEGIALDESVARAYRRDVPKLLAAIAALSSLRDAERADVWDAGFDAQPTSTDLTLEGGQQVVMWSDAQNPYRPAAQGEGNWYR